MIIRILPKRRDGKSSFLGVVAYEIIRDEKKPSDELKLGEFGSKRPRSKEEIFNRLIDYISRHDDEQSIHQILSTNDDGVSRVMFDGVLCETNTFSILTAAVEMNAVALQNTRCKDPVLHYIISWPATDNPTNDEIFNSVRYSLDVLGMKEHQYVAAIHTDTDYIHCHVSANRVNPISYKVANDSFSRLRLNKAARELELKHNWTPTNGCFVADENKNIVYKRNDIRPIPQGAKQQEYYDDRESLYSYAVVECRRPIDKIMAKKELTWRDLHSVLITYGLELKRKGSGLAVYCVDKPDVTPIKASTLHPDLTLSCLEKDLGHFESLSDVGGFCVDKNTAPEGTLIQLYRYDPTLHVSDLKGRLDRRLKRAEDRKLLRSRYEEYRANFQYKKMDSEVIKQRYQGIAKEISWQKAYAKITIKDPLLRKLTYNILEVEKMKKMAALKEKIKQERMIFYADPANRRLTYREWVEQEAVKQNQAAIAQLRGWSYRYKQSEKTARLSENAIICGVADDIKPLEVEGYQTAVKRDGTIQYLKDGMIKVQDTGKRLEVAEPYHHKGQNIVTAMVIAERKRGEKLFFSGEEAFVKKACGLVPWFNAGGDKPLPLTNPQQREMAGYTKTVVTDKRQVDNATPEPIQQKTKPKNKFTP